MALHVARVVQLAVGNRYRCNPCARCNRCNRNNRGNRGNRSNRCNQGQRLPQTRAQIQRGYRQRLRARLGDEITLGVSARTLGRLADLLVDEGLLGEWDTEDVAKIEKAFDEWDKRDEYDEGFEW